MERKAESGKQKIRAAAQVLQLDELEARLLRTTTGPDSTSVGLMLVELRTVLSAPRDREFDDVARILSRIVRQNDAVARVDGNTFVVLLTGLMGSDDARVVGERVQYSLTQGAETWQTSLGLALVGSARVDLADIWARARRALEMARESDASVRLAPVETLRVSSAG